MPDDPAPESSPGPRPPVRARRWSVPPSPPPNKSNRTLFRLIALPALAFAGVLIYRGVQERFTLPACDSSAAKERLSDLLSQLKAGPLREESIKTISSDKQKVVCSLAVQKPDGGTVAINYTFFWQGNSAEMRYAVSLKPPLDTTTKPPEAPMRTN